MSTIIVAFGFRWIVRAMAVRATPCAHAMVANISVRPGIVHHVAAMA